MVPDSVLASTFVSILDSIVGSVVLNESVFISDVVIVWINSEVVLSRTGVSLVTVSAHSSRLEHTIVVSVDISVSVVEISEVIIVLKVVGMGVGRVVVSDSVISVEMLAVDGIVSDSVRPVELLNVDGVVSGRVVVKDGGGAMVVTEEVLDSESVSVVELIMLEELEEELLESVVEVLWVSQLGHTVEVNVDIVLVEIVDVLEVTGSSGVVLDFGSRVVKELISVSEELSSDVALSFEVVVSSDVIGSSEVVNSVEVEGGSEVIVSSEEVINSEVEGSSEVVVSSEVVSSGTDSVLQQSVVSGSVKLSVVFGSVVVSSGSVDDFVLTSVEGLVHEGQIVEVIVDSSSSVVGSGIVE